MVTFDPKDETTWSKPFKAAYLWRVYGRSGLTVHAMASLCDLTPAEVMADIQDKGLYYSAAHCDTVKALVWWNYYRADKTLKVWWADKVVPWPTADHIPPLLKQAERELVQWPWPQYRAIHRGEGVTDGAVLVDKPLWEKNIRKYVNGVYASVTEARANLGTETEETP